MAGLRKSKGIGSMGQGLGCSLNKMVSIVISEKMTFELRLDACDEISSGDVWRKSFRKRGNSHCTSKMRVCLVHSRNSKELLVTGGE